MRDFKLEPILTGKPGIEEQRETVIACFEKESLQPEQFLPLAEQIVMIASKYTTYPSSGRAAMNDISASLRQFLEAFHVRLYAAGMPYHASFAAGIYLNHVACDFDDTYDRNRLPREVLVDDQLIALIGPRTSGNHANASAMMSLTINELTIRDLPRHVLKRMKESALERVSQG